jgi:predicted negative regulator of RcsB-dependent stress response
LEIVEIQIRRKNFDEARRTLEYIKDNFPNAEKHRKIYIGDIQEKWLPEWELFARQNPVTVANYVELKLAELDYEQSNYNTARNRLQKLIMRTKTPNGLRKSLNPTIRTAFDVHISSLELSLRIAENIGDEAWKRQIKALLQSAGEK